MKQITTLPNPRAYDKELSEYDRDLLRRLTTILAEHERQIKIRPCCAIEDPMWWLLGSE